MSTIHLFKTADPGSRQNVEEELQENIAHYNHEDNSMEGSEFLDDALRMYEQPLEEPEERKEEL